MLKKSLLSVVLMSSAGYVMADDYTYIAGGYQHGVISSKVDFNQQFNQNKSNIGNRKMHGYYLQGGYGFDNNLFIDVRLNTTANRFRGTGESLLGLGYHYTSAPNRDFYGVVGASSRSLVTEFDKNKSVESKSHSSLTGEVGVRQKVTPKVGLNAAYRLASYDKHPFHEARLGANYALTQDLAAEIGYAYHNWKVNDQLGQVGLRYTF